MTAERPTDPQPPEPKAEMPGAAPGKALTPEARRALEEAAARRAAIDAAVAAMPGEEGGAKGLEPTRYGDWEGKHKGTATDF